MYPIEGLLCKSLPILKPLFQEVRPRLFFKNYRNVSISQLLKTHRPFAADVIISEKSQLLSFVEHYLFNLMKAANSI